MSQSCMRVQVPYLCLWRPITRFEEKHRLMCCFAGGGARRCSTERGRPGEPAAGAAAPPLRGQGAARGVLSPITRAQTSHMSCALEFAALLPGCLLC